MIALSARGMSLSFDPELGMIAQFEVTDRGQAIAPLHRAPWVDTNEALPDGLVPHHYALGGDFFCAPFGGEENGSALHGWPANSAWTVLEHKTHSLCAVLNRPVAGAQLQKVLTLKDDHPFVYQSHVFSGGHGNMPVANHANIALPNGGLIRTSPKADWRTPDSPPEQDTTIGRSRLAYPAVATDPAKFPAGTGTADLTQYPWFPDTDDFVAGLEATGQSFGWTAVTRPIEGDVFLSLRRADLLPMTMLWHSNGGRDYPPWSGRHFGCLGVEEGAAATLLGSEFESEFKGKGAVSLGTGAAVEVRHVTGAIRWPSGAAIAAIEADQETLTLRDEDDVSCAVPFDGTFLSEHPV